MKKFSFSYQRIIIVVSIIFLAIILFYTLYSRKSSQPITTQNSNLTDQVAEPLTFMGLNKSYTFSILDAKGGKAGEIKYTLEKAELTKEMIYKGRKTIAPLGKIFLSIPLKITNDTTKLFKINAGDYVRLVVGGNTKELLAPEINNDPVEAQAIATKNSRIGFTIDEKQRDLILQIGEVNGVKDKLKLEFTK